MSTPLINLRPSQDTPSEVLECHCGTLFAPKSVSASSTKRTKRDELLTSVTGLKRTSSLFTRILETRMGPTLFARGELEAEADALRDYAVAARR